MFSLKFLFFLIFIFIPQHIIFSKDFAIIYNEDLLVKNEWEYTGNKNTDAIYIGEVKNGNIPHGFGKILWPNGTKYIGEHKNGMFHGLGKMINNKGNGYHGNWENNKYNGYGIITSSSDGNYQGYFKDNNYHGEGIFTSPDGYSSKGLFYKNEQKDLLKQLKTLLNINNYIILLKFW